MATVARARAKKTQKPLSNARLNAELAKATGWAVVNRFTGQLVQLVPSRLKARQYRKRNPTTRRILRVELVVKGARA